MSLGKRLHKIETSLTTKQAILLWVKRVQPFDEEYRKNELWARMPDRVRKRISGMVIEAALEGLRKREPLGQEAFAITLSIAHRRNLELLLMGLDWMEEQHEEHDIFARSGGWRARLVDMLTGLLLWKTVAQALRKYDNQSVLFTEEEITLIEDTESLVKRYNDLQGALPGWSKIDLAALEIDLAALEIDLAALESSIETELSAASGKEAAPAIRVRTAMSRDD